MHTPVRAASQQKPTLVGRHVAAFIRIAALTALASSQAAANDEPPPKVPDPGYPIMQCQSRDIVPTVIETKEPVASMMQVIVGSKAVVCSNSSEGTKILAYREWHCKGKDPVCVLSPWVAGEPTRGSPPKNDLDIHIGDQRYLLKRTYSTP